MMAVAHDRGQQVSDLPSSGGGVCRHDIATTRVDRGVVFLFRAVHRNVAAA